MNEDGQFYKNSKRHFSEFGQDVIINLTND
jgi:hypothetical protein